MRILTRMSLVILGCGLLGSPTQSQEPILSEFDLAQPPVLTRDAAIRQAQAPVPVRPTPPSAPTGPRPAAAVAAPVTPSPVAGPSGTAIATPPAVAPAPPSAPVPAANPETAALFGDGPAPSGGLFDTSRFSGGATPQMIGDQPTLILRQSLRTAAVPGLPQPFPPGTPPPPPNPRQATSLTPSVRGFKIAENQSPQPQDRVFFTFNYFTDLNGAINQRFESSVNGIRAYRYIGGFEKTFDNGQGSFGVRLPLNSISANSAISGNFAKQGGTSTSLGDISFFTKYVIKSDPKTGSLLSVGLELTAPTGPSQFGGARFLQGQHSTEIQPFIGYLLIRDRFYLHGFAALSTPSSVRDVTMVYNDIGIGYNIYRATDPNAFLQAIAPTFEAHINNPLTHRDVFNASDPSGTADVVDLTYGANFVFGQSSVATFGVVTPVTGPRPFNTEYIFLLNYKFGKTRRSTAPLPILGG